MRNWNTLICRTISSPVLAFLLYLWGIETQPYPRQESANLSFYFTYEELKLEESLKIIVVIQGFYFTYEELKPGL